MVSFNQIPPFSDELHTRNKSKKDAVSSLLESFKVLLNVFDRELKIEMKQARMFKNSQEKQGLTLEP